MVGDFPVIFFHVKRLSGTQYVRKLATAAAVSLALSSGGAFGLGLGDIEMRSALNQPMNAEIRLTTAKPGELDGMIVQLASPDSFARAGIERSPVLSDLKFSVVQSSGVAVIRISSQRPVVEPFLNFLLEVDWPQGRMVRELVRGDWLPAGNHRITWDGRDRNGRWAASGVYLVRGHSGRTVARTRIVQVR